jgi:uncharacterized membrane protein
MLSQKAFGALRMAQAGHAAKTADENIKILAVFTFERARIITAMRNINHIRTVVARVKAETVNKPPKNISRHKQSFSKSIVINNQRNIATHKITKLWFQAKPLTYSTYQFIW